jgi:hypothetical protein
VKNKLKMFLGIALITASLSFSNPAISAPTETVLGGATTVQLSQEFVGALGGLQVTPGAVGRSALNEGTALFPISGGAIDLGTIKTEIIHQGGLSLSAGGTVVKLTDFLIANLGEQPVLTGLVTANDNLAARVPLFALALPAVSPPLQPAGGKLVDLKGVGVTLTPEAAGALNRAFNVQAFTAGLNIGVARVKAVVHSR